MTSLKRKILLTGFVFFLVLFSDNAGQVHAQISTAPKIPVTSTPQQTTPTDAQMAKDKDVTRCEGEEASVIAECAKAPVTNSSRPIVRGNRRYICSAGKISQSDMTTTHSVGGKVDCATETQVAKETGNPACANLVGGKVTEDKNYCRWGTRELPLAGGMTSADVEDLKKKTKIKCAELRDVQTSSKIINYKTLSAQAATAATIPKQKKVLVICAEDQGDLQKYQEGRSATLQTISTAQPEKTIPEKAVVGSVQTPTNTANNAPIANKPLAGTVPTSPQVQQPGKQVVGAVGTPSQSVPSVTNTAPTTPKQEPFVTTNPGTPATQQPTPTQGTQQQTVPQAPIAQQAPVQQAPIAQVAPVTQPGKTPDTQNPNKYAYNSNLSNYAPANPTGTAPKAYTPSSSTSFFDTLFNRQPEPTQKSTPIIQNIYVAQNYPQNLLNGQLPQKSTPEKITPKDTTKKIDAPVKLDSTTKPLPEKEEAETEQSRLLKAILNAPSIEEVMERGGYDYQKVVNDSAKKVTEIKNVAPDKKSEEQEKVPDEVLTVKKTPPQQKIAPAQPILATADPKLNKPPVVEPEGSERTVLQNLFAQEIQNPDFALSKNNLAQNSQRRVTSEKPETVLQIAYTQLQSAIKKIPTAPKQDLSRAERDTLASQLLSLSEYLSGNTFGADPTTAETMNTVSRQLELAATDMAGNTPPATLLNSLKVAYGELSLEQAALKKSTYAGPEPKKFSDWTPAYFEAYKKEVADALDASKNPTAIKLYRDALSRLNTAELFKKSNQTYWNSEADLAEAKTKISLAGALERNTKLSLPETGSDVAESEEVRDTTDSAPQTNPEGIRGSPTPTKNMPGTTEVTPPANAPVQKSIIGKILSWFGW